MKLNNIRQVLTEHRYAILVAVLVALVAGLPQIVVRNALGSADRGMPYLVNDSEGEYLSRVHEVLDGHISLASPMLFEYKDSVALMPPTGEILFYALPVKLTGLSLNTVVFLSKFIYPALLFVLAYLLILSLLDRNDRGAKISAIAGALLIVIGYEAYDYRNFVSTILHGTSDASGLLWNRLVNPITGAMLLFAFLWLLSRVVQEKARWRTAIASGLVLAAMSGYIFSFALGLTISSLVGLYFLWRKNWTMALRVYTPVAAGLVVVALYVVGMFLTAHGTAPSDPMKVGMLLTHEPLINLIALATLAGVATCFILFFGKETSGEKEKRWWIFALATVIAGELVYNQQLVTGRTVWPQHFVQYTTPLSMVMMAVLLHNIVRRYAKNVWRIATALLILVAALFGWRGFEAASHNTLPRYAETQEFAGVFEYLNANAPKDCVVYVSSDYLGLINRFLPAFTGCNIYHSFFIYYGFPPERITHNYLVELRLRGIKLKDVENHFFADENLFFSKSYFYRDWRDVLCCDAWTIKFSDPPDTDRWFISVEKDIERQYAQYLTGDLYAQLTKYRLDYFVVDTRLQPQVNNKRYPFLSYRASSGPFVVYAVVPPIKK